MRTSWTVAAVTGALMAGLAIPTLAGPASPPTVLDPVANTLVFGSNQSDGHFLYSFNDDTPGWLTVQGVPGFFATGRLVRNAPAEGFATLH
jgi:hypothetical protein